MLKYIPIIKRFLVYALVALLLLVSTGLTITYVFQDKIIALFVEEVNEQIKTPVKVEKISLSMWKKFPNLTVNLKNVWMQEGVKDSTEPLAKARNIYFVLSLYQFIKGNYVIDEVHLEQAEVFLKVLPDGSNNYTIFEKDTTGKKKEGIAFQLEKINLDNVLLNYSDLKRNQEYSIFASEAIAKLSSNNNIFDVAVAGEMESQKIRVQEEIYFKDKQLKVKADFNYYLESDSINILPSQIFVHDSEFLVKGVYHGADQNFIKLTTTGENTDIQTILSLMSEKVYDKFKIYKSDGNFYFSSHLEGYIDDDSSPNLQIDFGCKDASFYHPDIKRKIVNVNLRGNFVADKANDLSTASLQLSDISGMMGGRPFKGDFYLKNFEDQFVKLSIDAEIDAQSLLEFYPLKSIKKATGLIEMDIAFEGKINSLKTKGRATPKTSGEIILKNLDFDLTSSKLPFNDFRGSFIFKNDDLAISDFSGRVGNSDFLLNGFFKNIIAYLIFENQPITIDADLNSNLLDIDELLTGDVADNPGNVVEGDQYYSFRISPKLELLFNCNVRNLKFRRFFAEDIRGKLKVKDQKAQATQVNLNAIGGDMTFNSSIDARNENHIVVETESSFERIHIDSIFYVFHNFNQEFLVDKHLKGQIFAEVNTYMVFDNNLRFDSKKFKSDVGVAIRNGELNNFEPMQKLSKFVSEESLSRLRFSELKNIIRIQDEIIYLPPMEVNSNISTIEVKGTHTFDQRIDYYTRVPLKTFTKKDRDAAFGAIEDNGSGGANIFLTIKGTTEDYTINYDTKAVKEKIKDDIRKEGVELKQVFKNKGQEKKDDIELNEDEYFDF